MRQLPLLLLTALVVACAAPAAAAMIDELSPADQAKLQAGQNIVTTIDKPGATWPEVRIYRKVKATPQGVTDLFLDYENASSFIDNLESAVVENQPDAQTKDVRYNVRLPRAQPLPKDLQRLHHPLEPARIRLRQVGRRIPPRRTA